jgi:hypothetical protein
VWARLAAAVRDRLVLSWLAGGAFWLAWLVSLALGGWTHDAASHRLGADHVQYYVVGELVNEGRPELIYDKATMEERQKEVAGAGWKGYLPFRYPAYYALCFAPTSRLSYEASYLTWTAIGVACLLLAGRLLGAGWRDWLVGSLCFFPVFAAVSFGQNSLVSLLLLCAAYALWRNERPFLAGLVAGLLAYKPQLLLGVGLLWLLGARRSWPALLGLALTGAALLALGYAVVPTATVAFFTSLGGNVAMQERHALPVNYGSQGFWLLLLPDLDNIARVLSVVTSVAGIVVFVLLWRRVRHRPDTAFAVAVLLTPWLTLYIMVYDWTILLIPAVLLAREPLGDRDRTLVLTAVLWLAAVVTMPLVRGQLALTSLVALQLSMPALVAVVLCLTGRSAGDTASHSSQPLR